MYVLCIYACYVWYVFVCGIYMHSCMYEYVSMNLCMYVCMVLIWYVSLYVCLHGIYMARIFGYMVLCL